MAVSFCRRSFLNYKNSLFQTQKRTGYVVLIPESSKEIAECNVVSLENLPTFSKLDAESCKHIVNKYAQQYDVGAWELDSILQKKLADSDKLDAVKHVIEPLEVLTVPYTSSWGVVKTMHISNVRNLPLGVFYPIADRFVHSRADKFNIKSIYTVCKKELEANKEKYTEEQRRIINKFIWEGILNGFEMNEKTKEDFNKCYTQMKVKTDMYEEKYKNSKQLFKQVVADPNFVQDSPLDFLRSTAISPDEPEKGPWIITLNEAVYLRFLEYCSSRDARRHIWLSYNQLASNHGDVRCNATSEVQDLRRYRKELAQMLGYPTYTHLTMKTKMARNVENVQNVLYDLLDCSRLAQEKEIYDLEKFAYSYEFKGSLELWDLSYWMRMEKKYKLGLDELTLKDYFPLSQVLLGLIALCEQLFGIEIEEQMGVDVWHPDVRYFRVSDEKTKTIFGGFYLDPYARTGKLLGDYNNGWFIPIRPRSKTCASLPLSSLIFSFTPPSGDKPSLLYFREIDCLFERFGQMLQFTLTQTNHSDVSGMSNIEWDAVNVCNKFLKLWLTEKGTLESISGHYESGEPLPGHLLDNLCNVHKQMAGTLLCRKIYYSNLDMELHLDDDHPMSIVERLWPEHLLFQLNPLDCHPYGFKDIFMCWGSSYYSVIWSEMIAADIFSAFMEVGFDKQEEISALGRRFRNTFLALGGGCDPNEVFQRFRGRNPNHKLLLDFLSIKKPTPTPRLNEPTLAIA